MALGERAGLVREQHLDVAEVLDADEALDDHPSACQAAGARRQADGHDRRQQLRSQADGDREREQSRLEDGTSQATLIAKIEPASTTVTVASRREKACSPCWKAVCPCRSPSRSGDRAERGVRTRADDDAAPVAAAHERAHERARRQIER